MRILVGIVAYGHNKDYAFGKFVEMMGSCILPSEHEITIAWSSDMVVEEQREIFPGHIFIESPPGMVYAEDMLIHGRNAFRLIAERGAFDKLCYQGLDCFWQSSDDFDHVANHDVPVVSALTCARNDSYYAVARRFKGDHGSITEEQEDIPGRELSAGGMVKSGFPGADAIFFRHDAYGVGLDDHIPWYKRVAEGRTNIECMEYTVLQLARQGKQAYVDADTKVWHVHEDCIARMWPGIERPLAELSWN